jgi:hypothetical protein
MLRRALKRIPLARSAAQYLRAKRLTPGGLRGRLQQYLLATGIKEWEPLVPESTFEECVSAALERLVQLEPADALGDYLEFGVSRGTSLACVHSVLRRRGLNRVRLIGFDSFQGMPADAAAEGWAEGLYHSTLNATRRYLASRQVDMSRVILIKGWFSKTLTEETRQRHNIGKASLIMVDSDTYSASKEALDFSAPHIREHAVLMFDDWGWRSDLQEKGQQEAFAEFLDEHPDLTAEPMEAYLPQARVFLVTGSRSRQPTS